MTGCVSAGRAVPPCPVFSCVAVLFHHFLPAGPTHRAARQEYARMPRRSCAPGTARPRRAVFCLLEAPSRVASCARAWLCWHRERGLLLQHLIDASQAGSLGARDRRGRSRTGDGTRAVARAEAAGIPAFVCRVGDYDERADWDKALTEICAGFRPDLVVSAGFMKLLGAAFLDEFAGRCINSHPRCSRPSPACTASATRCLRREGHRLHRVPRGRGPGQRAGGRPAGRARPRRRRRGSADRADQVGRARPARRTRSPRCGRRLVRVRPTVRLGRHGSPDRRTGAAGQR